MSKLNTRLEPSASSRNLVALTVSGVAEFQSGGVDGIAAEKFTLDYQKLQGNSVLRYECIYWGNLTP